MRKEETIRAEIAEKTEAARATDSISEELKLTAEIKKLHQELSDTLSDGAKACECGQKPMGILKTPFFEKPNGDTIGPVYEVGCVFCPTFIVDADAKRDKEGEWKYSENARRHSISSRGPSVEVAVKRWNDREFVFDGYIDRVNMGMAPPSPGRKIAQFEEGRLTGYILADG